MSSKPRRGAVDRGKESSEGGAVVDRKMIETIKEATGATEEDIRVMLFECNYDANETTSRLIDNPFSQVQSRKDKKKRRDEDKKKEPAAKIVEVRRSTSTGGRGRGHDRERGPRGERGDRTSDKGSRAAAAAVPEWQPATDDEPVAAGWDLAASRELEPLTDQPTTSPGWGDLSSRAPGQNSAPQPIAPRSQPAPIRPPGSRTGGKSMADLFKQPAVEPVADQQPEPPTAPGSSFSTQREALEPNGWASHGHSPSIESDPRLGGSLGGVAISAPKKSQSSQQLPIQAGSTGSYSAAQTPVGSLSNIPSSPSRSMHRDEQVGAPSTTGLGGVLVDAPPRPQGHSQPNWMPKAPAAPAPGQQPTLGSSILSSLNATSSAPLGGSDLLTSQSPRTAHQQPELGLGGSTFGKNQSPVILPPGAQQGSNDLGGLSFQFGNFGLGSASPDMGAAYSSAGFASAFEPATLTVPEASQPLPSSESFKPPSYSQPQPSAAQSQQQQQQQQQRAYSAFTSAGIPQLPSAEGPIAAAASAAPEASAAASQALYSNQGYQNYGSGQGYSQYQAPAAAQQQQPYQNYAAFTPQAPAEAEQQAPAVAHQAHTAAPKRSAAYDASAYANYGQPGVKDYQTAAAKYGNPNAASVSHLTGAAAATGPTSGPAAAAVAAQMPLSQMSGYGAAQVSLGAVPAQNYYGAQQQYGSQYPQYNNYSHPSNSYGYGQNAYQQGGYSAGNQSYGQGGKYGGYAAAGGAVGGGYQQHAAGGYGSQPHKQEKEHQAAHLGGHNLYGQQQVPLGGQQQYQGAAGLRDHTAYGGYQNPNHGYSGYGMGTGRQYNQQYYGRDQ